MKDKKSITEAEVQNALQKFIRGGGLINHLPDEVAPRNLMVGGKWGIYEPVMEITTAGAGVTTAGSGSAS